MNDLCPSKVTVPFRFNDGRDWFFEHRFGLFIHWGLYAVNGWQEQEQFRLGLSRKAYTPLMERFNPVNFNPDAWLDAAEAAGMSYLCFTTKHIDGFCMWDTAVTGYRITNTPYGRDVLAMLAEACHRRGFPLCLYYAVPDMNCRCYPNRGRSYELPGPEQGDEPDVAAYLDFVKAQVSELCSNYGKIHGFWWDANEQTVNIRDESVNRMIRSLQPGIIINNRGFDSGDFSTPERDYDDARLQASRRYDKATEACESIGAESWGFRSHEDYFSVGFLTRNIARHLAKGGNYLLNVGPRADGALPPEALRIMTRIGAWYRHVDEAFCGVEPGSELTDNPAVLITRNDQTLYVHLVDPPDRSGIILSPVDRLPYRATVLNDGRSIAAAVELMPSRYRERRSCLHLWNIPVDEFAGEAIVLKLEFEPGAFEPSGRA